MSLALTLARLSPHADPLPAMALQWRGEKSPLKPRLAELAELLQHLGDLRGRHRSAIGKALHLGAAFRAHLLELLQRFHAFGRRGHAETLAERRDRANDRDGIGIDVKIMDEALVDLDLVEGEA